MRLGGEVHDRLTAGARLGDGRRVGDVAATNWCSMPARFARFPAYVSLSSTTTSSPRAASRLTKCDPMKPAPPVTSTRIGKGSREAGRAPAWSLARFSRASRGTLAKAVAPVRQARGTTLAAQDRVRRAGRFRAPLRVVIRRTRQRAPPPRRSPRQVGPGAVPAGGEMPDAERGLGRRGRASRLRGARRTWGSRAGRRRRRPRPARPRAAASCGRSSWLVGPKSHELRTTQAARRPPPHQELRAAVRGTRSRAVGLDVGVRSSRRRTRSPLRT